MPRIPWIRQIRSIRLLAAATAVLACMLAASPSEGQRSRPLTAPAEFTLDQWTTADGLPQNSVNDVAQTADGYVWVGTFGGLARFDGLRFDLIERTDGAGRHVDRVLSLAVARDGALWVGTENGLLRYRAGRFQKFSAADGMPDYEITALYVDRGGTLWVGTEHGGIARYDGRRFVAVRHADGRPFDGVHSFREDRAGTLWINARGSQQTLADTGAEPSLVRQAAGHAFQSMLLEDRGGSAWFRRADGVGRVRESGVDLFDIGFGPEAMIEQAHDGRYWLATYGNGVLELRADRSVPARTYPLADGNVHYGARSLLDGLDGSVWVGTATNGLLRLRPNLFTTYRQRDGLSHDVITPVMEARDGTLWVGTNCGGVNAIDPSRRTVRHELEMPNRDACVFALAQDSSGAVWVGTYGGGLARIVDGVPRRLGGLGVLRDSTIMALYTARDGTLWIGTKAGGLAEVHGERVRRVYTTADGLAHNSVRVIHQTRDGALWIGTLEGLTRLGADGRMTTYHAANGLSSEYVRALHEDDDGTLWIGTYGGGLNRLRGGKFVAITRADGLPDNVVSSILDDGRGNLWMTGNRGIFRVGKAQLNQFADGALHRVHSVLYGKGDGLVNAETNGGFQPASWKDRRGRLWFPTIDGLATVDPAAAIAAPRPLPVTLEEIVVDGATMAPVPSLRIGPGRPNVEFRYTAVSLASPEHETFRYRLEGFETEWVEPGTRRVAYYSRLPAGQYRFVVTAASRDGAWNPAVAAMDVLVLAPLYMRPWFLAVALLGVALTLWGTHRAVLRTRSEAIRDERSRLAREIHDSLLQGFGGIALQLHAASARLALSASQRQPLDRVLAMIDRTLTQARQAVWDIRPTDTVTTDLVTECEEAARRVLAGVATEARVVVHGRPRRLSRASRTECLRIVEEALTNVRKHAEAGRAVVDVQYGWRYLRLTISDDGRGFDLARDGNRPGHWGLLGIRERASRIGARLTVHGHPGVGTTVSVDVPYRGGPFGWRGPSRRKD